MFCTRFRVPLLTAFILVFSSRCLADGTEKGVKFETVPSGAHVELNGSVVCMTPCSISVPAYYFGNKYTAFSRHEKEPINVRLLREGCAPKAITITAGPLQWHSAVGIKFYKFYLVRSNEFSVHLDAPEAPDDSYKVSDSPPKSAEERMPSACGKTATAIRKELVDSATGAVVAISTPSGLGSGFLVSSDGLLITDSHLISGYRSLTVIFSDGKTVEASSVYVDKDRDLAVAKIPGVNYPYLKLSKAMPPAGADIFQISSLRAASGPQTGAINQAIVIAVRRNRSHAWIETDAPFDHDNSGGPVLDRSGEVVGVNTPNRSVEVPGFKISAANAEIEKLVHSHFGVSLSADGTK